jgi:hypothetical protein
MAAYQPFSINFWSMLFMHMATAGALIASVKYGQRMKQLKFIPYYTAVALLQDSIGFSYNYLSDHPNRMGAILVHTSENIFMLLEFILLNNFLLHSIVSKKKRRITKITAFIFLLILLAAWIIPTGDPMHKFGFLLAYYELFALESLFLVLPCLFYFYELFKLRAPINLRSDPPFWIATGILFYNSCSIPLFLLIPILKDKFPELRPTIYSLNYILYSMFFLLLIRASYLARNVGQGSDNSVSAGTV